MELILYKWTFAPCLAVLLSGCGEPAQPAPDPDPREKITPSPTESSSRLDVQSMTYDEFSPLIESGLGCSFSAADDTLLVATAAMGEAVVAKGVVKLGGEPQVVTAQESGGYDALVDGATFSDDGGLSITITRTSEEGTPGEIETTSWPAEMVAGKSGQAPSSYTGFWACGA